MKGKKIVKAVLLSLLSLVVVAAVAAGVFLLTYKATVVFDCAETTGAVMHGASGCLYGLAENGVPSETMVQSLRLTTAVQKVPGGLQHPIGDLDNVAPNLTDTVYNVVYLQDMYPTWYYLHDEIMTARAAGTYDPDQLLRDDYLPKVTQKVKELSTASYADRLVYCLYNECDNALWFGESVKDDNPDNPYGVWCDFNDAGKDAFHRGWQATFDAVRAVAPDALIGGPGYSGWNADATRRFLAFCKENDCLPDVMIYHELGDRTAYYFDDHLAEYRAIEQELGLQPLPVLISEYGMMNETGCPGKMVQYITQMETCKVYGDSAFWRLADNLNDTCADANTPNANWWLYRWYAEMNGETVKATNYDWLSSDFKNSLRDHRALSFRGFMGIASVSEEGVDVVCGGGERRARVVLKGLDAASLKGKRVTVTVEETVYKGIFGAVTAPTVLKTYTVKAGARLSVDLGEIDPVNAYRITVREATGAADYENPDRPARYEFEDGTLHGGAYTYDSYCPASGDTDAADTVGGLENRGDGVTLPFTVPRDGDYLLDFIYGKANDGAPDETGHVSPDDRVSAEALLSIDGAPDETVYLPNTIKSEYSSCYTRRVSLTAGAHTVTMRHGGGTYVLDCLVVTAADDAAVPCPVLPDGESDGAAQYLAVVPQDGLYTVTAAGAEALTFNGNAAVLSESGAATVYLRRGLNPLTLTGAESAPTVTFDGAGESTRLLPKEAALTGSAGVGTQTVGGEACDCLQNLCDGAAATWTFNAPADGVYAVTVTYSNNDENGVHDYNVDLLECCIVLVCGEEQRTHVVPARNTCSWQSTSTVVAYLPLQKGTNTLTLCGDNTGAFNGTPTPAPCIFSVAVTPAQQ